MNEPQREGSAESLEEVEQEKLQEIFLLPQDSIDNFTCPTSPGSTQVTWTTRYDSSGRLVNIVCWDTSSYVSTIAINLSRIERIEKGDNPGTSHPLLTNVSGYSPPYVDRSGINSSHWYQYSLEIPGYGHPRVSVIAQPHPHRI